MPLRDLCVLVMIADAVDASELVRCVERAGGDVVAAANAYEALQRLKQFVFNAAVVDCSGGAESVVEELCARSIPFCVCKSGSAWKAPLTVPVHEVTVALAAKIAR